MTQIKAYVQFQIYLSLMKFNSLGVEEGVGFRSLRDAYRLTCVGLQKPFSCL